MGYSIVDYERAHENADFADLEDMIAATGSLIAAQAGKNIGDYVPGSVQESLAYQALANAVLGVYNKWGSQQDALALAVESESERIEELTREGAEARKQQGNWKRITGALILVGSVALIVMTAGAATLIAGAALIYVAGTSAAVYGAAEYIMSPE